jgi:hypothetical protein
MWSEANARVLVMVRGGEDGGGRESRFGFGRGLKESCYERDCAYRSDLI